MVLSNTMSLMILYVPKYHHKNRNFGSTQQDEQEEVQNATGLWYYHGGAVVAERLRPLISIPEVPGSNPGPAVAPLGKALYPHCLIFRRRL